MAKNTKKPWQGRFSGKTDKFVEGFTSSIDFDHRLYEYDIQGSVAHSMMLNSIGILNNTELKKIKKSNLFYLTPKCLTVILVV